ncbi:MAG TPA: ABC transporter substrate-binding protein [Candidatus Binatia bacterium]|jgi:phospholipid transport system substrate-binding protein|nr:ABC transporter substrate-binding protein [Candidatus Binatia bacterium]
MHRKIRQIEIGIFVFTLCLGFSRFAQAGEPLEVVRVAVDKAVQILKDPKLQSQDKKKERVDRLREALNPIFDYEEMAKRALGSHWRRRTPAEQEEFVKLFRDFLEKIYSDKVDLYGGEKVRFGREMIDKDFAQVESAVIKPNSEEIAVSYKLRQMNGQWKVYDVVVENISIVNNYRSQFDRVISSSSYEELVKRLQEKARQDA